MSIIGALIGAIASLIILAISIVISLLISQPFTGALVRLRANYLPKAVSLDNVLEDGALAGNYDGEDSDELDGQQDGRGIDGAPQMGSRSRSGVSPRAISAYFLRERQSSAKIGPVVSGIIAMLTRTKRLEGWPGVYKGSAPVVLQLLLMGFVTLVFFSTNGGFSGAGGGAYRASPSGPGQFGFWTNLLHMVVTGVVALPLNVITNRAIVHPRILAFRNVRDNLRELLSYSEYSQPWRLFVLPGLLAAELCHIGWIGFVTRIIRHVTVPSLGGLPPSTPATPDQDTYTGPSSDGSPSVSTIGLSIFLAWCVVSVVILSPLEVIIVRLSVQRPERQQPLHMAYARLPGNGPGAATGPASYNDQAQVQQTVNAARRQDGSADDAPTDPLPRPSFAVEDEDEEDDGEGRAKTQSHKKDAPAQTNEPQPAAPPRDTPPSRTLGGSAQNGQPRPSRGNGAFYHRMPESTPSEPVIALRPCDEPLSPSDAQRAESEGFGAPTVERYTGLVDCLNKLVDEEGVEALYRGAWVTLLFMLAGNFA